MRFFKGYFMVRRTFKGGSVGKGPRRIFHEIKTHQRMSYMEIEKEEKRRSLKDYL